MLNRFATFSKLIICTGLLATVSLALQKPVVGEEPGVAMWGTFGNNLEDDSANSYGGGVKTGAAGIEIVYLDKDDDDDSIGVDALGFILPKSVFSPYLGLGIYTQGEGVGVSGGAHINTSSFVFGVGYHSIRGLNGQIGIQFN